VARSAGASRRTETDILLTAESSELVPGQDGDIGLRFLFADERRTVDIGSRFTLREGATEDTVAISAPPDHQRPVDVVQEEEPLQIRPRRRPDEPAVGPVVLAPGIRHLGDANGPRRP